MKNTSTPSLTIATLVACGIAVLNLPIWLLIFPVLICGSAIARDYYTTKMENS